MTQPATVRTLSDAERAAILDERLKSITAGDHFRNRVESRSGYQAIVVLQSKPMTIWTHLGCLVLTLMSLGIGLFVWIALMISRSRSPQRVLLEVSPDGAITQRKLPNDGSR